LVTGGHPASKKTLHQLSTKVFQN